MAKYGLELIEALRRDIETTQKAMENRAQRIENGFTDLDDCFISVRCDERNLNLCRDKIDLLENGGVSWFNEYATLDGKLVKACWCNTRYGSKLRAELPDGSIVWTSALTKKGLAKKGLKMVQCLRPAWYTFRSSQRGMLGVYTGSYQLFPSDINYATGETASTDPISIRDYEE